MQILSHPSPNHDSRGGAPVDTLVLHYTGMRSGREALARLIDPQAKVSAHYLVEEDGRIFKLVEEDQRAWHAGISCWRGCTDMNARSIGIEIVNPGHEWGYRPFPEPQIVAVIDLCHAILSRHAIAGRNIVGHSDIAFRRKEDPGELFPWERLAGEGIGLWHGNPEPYTMQPLKRGDSGEAVLQLEDRLVRYGYDVPVEGIFDEVTEQCVIAFQRHFRPGLISGVWDGDCAARLDALLDRL